MPNAASLPVLLKQLKLSSMAKTWERSAHKAIEEQWLPQDYLAMLCEQEVADRYHKRLVRYTREAQLPAGKTLSEFDFTDLNSIKKQRIIHLIQASDWVHRGDNVLLFGPSGVGKTHLAAAIGYGLLEKGIRVKFSSATALVQQLQKAHVDLGLMDALTRLDKYQVLIIDDIGYVKKTDRETQVLFELIAHRYESGSLIITSNQVFGDWDRIFDDNMMTVAAIDRLVHHASIIECNEDSYRKKHAINQATHATE